MKNFIYISMIAVMFLCSCKNSSFLSQRYTHFDHAKKSNQKQAGAKQQENEDAVYVAEVQKKNQEDPDNSRGLMPAAEMAAAKADFGQDKTDHVITADNVTTSGNGFHPVKKMTSLVNTVKLSSEHVLKAAHKQASSASHRGLIFGLINLALFIVICVLVVAGVIFLLTILL